MLIDRQGRVLVADRENNRVQICSQDGRYLGEIRDLHKPMAIAEGPEGLIYVTDQTPRLHAFDPEGRLTVGAALSVHTVMEWMSRRTARSSSWRCCQAM